jgi:hypothetical protein
MKKLLSTVLAVMFMFGMFTTVEAASSPEAMEKAADKYYEAVHYDYKKGTLELKEVETFVGPENNEVYAAVAHYETIRDDWYLTTHTSLVFFDATNNKLLTKAEAMAVEGIADFEKKHKDALHAHMHWGVVFFINLLVVIVPAVVLVVWSKKQYSTTSFQIANNILGNEKSFN